MDDDRTTACRRRVVRRVCGGMCEGMCENHSQHYSCSQLSLMLLSVFSNDEHEDTLSAMSCNKR